MNKLNKSIYLLSILFFILIIGGIGLVEGADLTLKDNTQQGTDLVNLNATYNSTTQAYMFDGVSSRLNSTYSGLTIYSPFTISVKAIKNELTSNGALIIKKQSATSRFQLNIDNTNNTYFTTSNSTGTNDLSFNTGATPLSWTTYTVTCNGTNKSIYINYLLKASVIVNDCRNSLNNTGTFTIGERGADNTLYWNGSISEVKVWNISLSATEVSDVVNNLSVQENSMVVRYSMKNCTPLKNNLNLNESMGLCLNEVYYNNDDDLNGIININGNNLTLEGNNATLIGNWTLNTYGINMKDSTRRTNVTIQNINIKSYKDGLDLGWCSNCVLRNITSSFNTWQNFYTVNVTNILIDNILSFNSSTQHGIYIDGIQATSNNMTIQNSNFSNNYVNGIYINSGSVSRINDIVIKNNILNSNGFYGIRNLGGNTTQIFNNTISNNGWNGGGGIMLGSNRVAFNLGAINNLIYSNTFVNNLNREWYIESGAQNNNVSNNIYVNKSQVVILLSNYNNSVNYTGTFNETNNLIVGYSDPQDRNMTWSYVGNKYFSYVNATISLINQLSQYPYNDIKNISTNSILSSNVDNYSITLSPNQQIEVGNFPIESIDINPKYSSAIVKSTPLTLTINASSNKNWTSIGISLVDLTDNTGVIYANTTDTNKSFMVRDFDLTADHYYSYYGYIENLGGSFALTSNYTFRYSGEDCYSSEESWFIGVMKVFYVLIVLLFLIGGIYLFKNDVINTEGMIFFVVGTVVLIVFMPLIFNLINNSIC